MVSDQNGGEYCTNLSKFHDFVHDPSHSMNWPHETSTSETNRSSDLLICIYAGNGTLHLKVRIKWYDAVILNKMGHTRVNKYIDPGYLCFLHHFSSSLKSLILLGFEISKQNFQVKLKLESTHSLRPLCCWSMYKYCINIFLILENKIVILLTKSDLSKMSIRGNTSLAWTPCICK